MKLIESLEDLQCWEDYQEFLKVQLKLLGTGGESFFVSKEQVDFDMGGKPWSGFAVLAGPKAAPCTRVLQKEGVLFREGTCGRQGKELRVEGLDPRLVKGAAKTLKKLMLGYKLAGFDEEGEPAAPGAGDTGATDGATPQERAKKMQELQKLQSDLGRLLAVLNK